MELTSEQKERYHRHLLLKGFGEEGQKKLLEGKVLIIGAGGLASPVALYLAAAGVGTIGIADADVVDLSNLQRQIIHSSKTVAELKVESAKQSMLAINPNLTVHTYPVFVSKENIDQLIIEYDFIIDASDNFETKFLINDACVKAKKAFSYGGVLGYEGQLMTYVPEKGPCYRCFFEEIPPEGVPNCRQEGVLGAIVGVVGTQQAVEAVKYLTGIGELLVGTILTYNGLTAEFRKIKFPQAKDCLACGNLKG